MDLAGATKAKLDTLRDVNDDAEGPIPVADACIVTPDLMIIVIEFMESIKVIYRCYIDNLLVYLLSFGRDLPHRVLFYHRAHTIESY